MVRYLMLAGTLATSLGCEEILPAGEVTLETPAGDAFGGVWAAGAMLEVQSRTSGLALPQLVLDGDATFDADGPFWGGSIGTRVATPGSFDVIARGPTGREMTRAGAEAVEPAALRLAEVDLPWGVDLVWPPDAAMVEGGYAHLDVVGVEWSGQPLLGRFPGVLEATGDGLGAYTIEGDVGLHVDGGWPASGAITLDRLEGEWSTTVEVVSPDAMVALEVYRLGGDARELVAIGRLADGRPVMGLWPEWDGLYADNRYRPDGDGLGAEACLATLCARYAGATWPPPTVER
jgi:hypothetical protein